MISKQAGDWGRATLAFLVGLVASALPARWRRAVPLLEGSAWGDAGVPSALLQLLVSAALFASAFMGWYHGQYDAIDAAAEARGSTGRWDVGEQKVLGAALMAGNPFLVLIFALTTPSGFALLVSAISSTIRLLHQAITREVVPDPVLAVVDWGVAKLQRRAASTRREAARDRSPDRLIVGGRGEQALVIESAREFDWREGNTVVVAGTWYRLVRRSEQQGASGLRQRYELELMPQGVAIRGMRRYDPGHAPIVSGADAAQG